MESDTLIGDGGGPAEKTSYHAAPAAMPGSGPKFTKKTVFGDVRNWKRFSWLEWLFVVIAALTILIILGMSIERFVTFEQDFENISMASGSGFYLCNKWTCTNDFIFTVVLVLNIVFSVVYVVHGLLQERMYALVAYSVTIIIIMFYVIVNYWSKDESKARLEPLRLIRLVLVMVGGPINIFLSSIISYRMGFLVFTTVGVNTTLIRAYKIRSFLLILQIILLQAMANVLTLSWSRDGHFLHILEMVFLCLLLFLCIIVIILGFTAVVFEKQWLLPVWYFILSPYYAYFVYKIVNVCVNIDEYDTSVLLFNTDGESRSNFIYIGCAVIVFCGLGLLVLSMMYLFMAIAHRNFKKGLKEKVPPPTEQWQGVWRRLSSAGLFSKKPPTSPIA